MKKILCLILVSMLILTSCKGGKDKKYITDVPPSLLLTADDISPYIDYSIKADKERITRSESYVNYLSDPLGSGEAVIVRISQKNKLQSAKEVNEMFEKSKSMRSDAIDVELDADAAYITYPTIHYYIDGYYVQITAGSGCDDMHKALLINLADESIKNFRELTGIGSDDNKIIEVK